VSWLGLDDRTLLVTGFANRKSVAWHVGRSLADAGARVVWSVRSEERRAQLAKLLPEAPPGTLLVCDVERDAELDALWVLRREWRRAAPDPSIPFDREFSAEEMERLGSLGYLGGADNP
jgi:NAD(P)-dependent dehydrogenase (short-subunit alcohol dehydrogenase family)